MSSFETLETRRDDDLLWIRLNQPDKANALSPVMLAELIIGRNRQLNPVGAFRKIMPGTAVGRTTSKALTRSVATITSRGGWSASAARL